MSDNILDQIIINTYELEYKESMIKDFLVGSKSETKNVTDNIRVFKMMKDIERNITKLNQKLDNIGKIFEIHF